MKLLVALVAVGSAFGHGISMSSGELIQSGTQVRYKVRLPMFELQHVPRPELAIPDAIRLDGGRRIASQCRQEGTNYICEMDWEYPLAPSSLVVQVWLSRITVVNHVHVLQARRGDELDQAVFQGVIDRHELMFRREGPLLTAVRSRPSMLLMAVFCSMALLVLSSGWMGLAACCIAFAAAAFFPTPLTPAFLEASVAVIAAYASFEAAFLPKSRFRWVIAMLLGTAGGFYSAVLVGNLGVRELTGLGVLLCAGLLAIWWHWGRRTLSFGLLAAGLVWIGVLLR